MNSSKYACIECGAVGVKGKRCRYCGGFKMEKIEIEEAEVQLGKLREQKPIGIAVACNKDSAPGFTVAVFEEAEVPAGSIVYAETIPAPAVPDANPVQWLADEGDMILVPRGLLGAACSSIDKQRPAPKVLEALRYYTMNAPQHPAAPTVPANCRQRLQKEGKPYPRSSCSACGKLSPKWRECDALLQSTGGGK